MIWMRFVEDTQVEGRFFPRGAEVEVIAAGAIAIVPPDPAAHATMCAVSMKRLVALKAFRVLLLNREAGLAGALVRLGIDEADVRASIERRSPACEVLEVSEVSGDQV
ncbi:hypothetical protein [Roseateles sp.]|uniref:hypothetical protein n=1 Tax=Roseateles sp. TaxID=1971397 RepID=UPI0039E808C2